MEFSGGGWGKDEEGLLFGTELPGSDNLVQMSSILTTEPWGIRSETCRNC